MLAASFGSPIKISWILSDTMFNLIIPLPPLTHINMFLHGNGATLWTLMFRLASNRSSMPHIIISSSSRQHILVDCHPHHVSCVIWTNLIPPLSALCCRHCQQKHIHTWSSPSQRLHQSDEETWPDQVKDIEEHKDSKYDKDNDKDKTLGKQHQRAILETETIPTAKTKMNTISFGKLSQAGSRWFVTW